MSAILCSFYTRTVTIVTDTQTFKGTLGEESISMSKGYIYMANKKKIFDLYKKNTALNNSLLYKVMLASQYLFADTIKSFRV